MLRSIMNKFLILHDVRGVMVIRNNGIIIEGIKSGIDYDDTFQSAVSALMVGSKATADTFGNTPVFLVFMEFSEYFLLLSPLKEEFFLLIIAQTTANIGQINQEMKKNKEEIAALL